MKKHSTISPEGLDRAILVWMQELSPHGVCATDAELRIQGWNLWMESASGLKREEVIGRKLSEVFPQLRERRLDAYFEKALKGEISVLAVRFHQYLFPFPSPVKDAGFTNMLQTARIAPLMQNYEVVGTITTIEDVTEREHQNLLLRKQSERQELFSWSLAHLLQSRDPDTLVKKIFPRVSAHLGLDVYFNYLLESDGKMRLHSAGGISEELRQRIAVREVGEALCEGTAAGAESYVLSEVDRRPELEGSIARELGLRAYVCHALQVDDKMIGTLSFGSRSRGAFTPEEVDCTRVVARYVAVALERLRNLTALQNAREELSRHAQSLEVKVQERTAKLQESIAELESFSYSLAHDVRAPLRHIQGYAQLLVEDSGTQLPEQARSHLEAITRSIRKLDSLTEDMLAYSQLSRQAIRMVPVNLEDLVQDILTRNPALGKSGVVIVQHPLAPVIGERVLLDQCLSNLMDNALKFVAQNVQPRIVIRTEVMDAENRPEDAKSGAKRWVRIWVEDNGIGVAPEFHARIFGIFERLGRHAHGTGIGLAIVAKAIDRMGGRVGVESSGTEGSRFWLELPAVEKEQKPL